MGVEREEGYKKRVLFVGESSHLGTGFSTLYRELLPRLVATGKMEIAELGCYASDDDPNVQAFIQGRWKFYGNNPKTQQEQELFNQPDPAQPGQNTNQFGKWKFDAVLADFRPDIVIDIRDHWMCLLQGTAIFTSSGTKDVSEIEIGDKVLTDDGTFQKVINTFERNYRGVTHKITPSRFRIPVHVTDKHPILAVVRENKHRKNRGGWPDFTKVEPVWMSPEDLTSSDFVCYPIPKEEIDNGMSDQMARFLGYYAAEGCFLYEGRKSAGKFKGIQLTFGTNVLEQSYVKDVVGIIKEEFGVDAKVKVINNCVTNIRAHGRDMAEFVHKHIPGLAKTKCLSDSLLLAPKSIVANLLTGLFRGDGCIQERRGSYVTSSESLAYNVFYLCVKLGFVPSFGYNKNTLNDKIFYRYIFSFVGQKGVAKECYKHLYNGNSGEMRRDYSHSNDDYVFLPISKIERDEGETTVYNFEVDNKQSYTSSFVMHNCAYQERSPFRKYFSLLMMPTVDSIPQKEEWIQTYNNVTYLMAYSDFGIDSLRKSSPKLELRSDPPGKPGFVGLDKVPGKLHPVPLRPGVDLKTFCVRTVEEKGKLKQKWGIKPDIPIVLLVQRNQARKRISEVMAAFAMMKNKYPDNETIQKSVLVMHTSWPDNAMSIDFPRAVARIQTGYHGCPVKRKGIMREILSTFMCHNQACGDVFLAPSIALRQGNGTIQCVSCGQQSARTPTTGAGITREQLSEVYGMSDMLVQMSIAEGDGMVIQESKACGVPTLVTDYAAIAEKGRIPDYDHIDKKNYTVHLGGKTMKVTQLYEEPETTCWRAATSMEDCMEKMAYMLSNPKELAEMGLDARKCAEEHYDWNKNWKEWEFIIDHITPLDRDTTWDKPMELIEVDTKQPPEGLSDDEFIVWCYLNLLGYKGEHDIDDDGRQNWAQKLTVEASRGVPSENTRKEIVNYFRQQGQAQNTVEQMRAGKQVETSSTENKDNVFEAIIV